MAFFILFLSLLIVSLGQPAWVSSFGQIASAIGFALFWKGMIAFEGAKQRFVLATLWFAAVQAIQLSWLTTLDYMGPLIIGLYLFLIFGMGIQFGLISIFVERSLRWHRILALAGSWVIFEWTRLFFLCGFTWNPVGLSLTTSHYSLQFASLWGIFGLSFWVILANLMFFKAWVEKSMRGGAFWAVIAVTPYLYGLGHQVWNERFFASSKTLKIALIQTNLSPEQKEFSSSKPDAYIPPLVQWEQILNSLKGVQGVDLIVLPEAALPLGAHRASYLLSSATKKFEAKALAPLKQPYAMFDRGFWKVSNVFFLQTLANQYSAHVITGLDDRDFLGKYNAAFHFRPNNAPYERYEKQVLVPIGEYIPLSHWKFLAQFIGKEFGIYSSFDPGTEEKIFNAKAPVGISICLEETFTHIFRNLRRKGAKLFVSVSNDAWFPRSKLAQQHFDHGRVRAVENGASIVRSCNSGVTCAIDPFGRTIEKIERGESRAASLVISVPLLAFPTLYTWWGDGAILGISVCAILLTFIFQKKKLL